MPIGAILGGAIAGGGSLFSGILGAGAANSAANQQAQAAAQALALEQQIYGTTTGNLAPYRGIGQNALGSLATGLGISDNSGFSFNSPLLMNPQGPLGPYPTLSSSQLPIYDPSVAGFQASPGYNFQVQQGTNAIQNASTGPQGTLSGNMLRGVGNYVTGLANQDYYNWINQIYNPGYQSRLQNVLLPYQSSVNAYTTNLNQADATQANAIAALQNLVGTGQNASVQTGGFGAGYGGAASGLLTGGGAARAAGTIGSANALGGVGNALSTYLLSSPSYSNTNLNAIISALGGGSGNNVNSNALAAFAQNPALLQSAFDTGFPSDY